MKIEMIMHLSDGTPRERKAHDLDRIKRVTALQCVYLARGNRVVRVDVTTGWMFRAERDGQLMPSMSGPFTDVDELLANDR